MADLENCPGCWRKHRDGGRWCNKCGEPPPAPASAAKGRPRNGLPASSYFNPEAPVVKGDRCNFCGQDGMPAHKAYCNQPCNNAAYKARREHKEKKNR